MWMLNIVIVLIELHILRYVVDAVEFIVCDSTQYQHRKYWTVPEVLRPVNRPVLQGYAQML